MGNLILQYWPILLFCFGIAFWLGAHYFMISSNRKDIDGLGDKVTTMQDEARRQATEVALTAERLIHITTSLEEIKKMLGKRNDN